MSPLEALAATAAVALGSVVQAASGVGAGFLITPLLAFISLDLVPGPVIFASLSLSGLMLWRERGAVDRQRVPVIFAGIALGSVAGGWVLANTPPDRLGVIFGTVILLAIGLTSLGLEPRPDRRTALAAGMVAGAMGTSTGVGAPALAILYQRDSGPRVRATLALLYTMASLFILLVLAAYGQFGTRDAANGLALIPGHLLGYAAANRYRHQLDGRATRPLVLGVSGIAALALLARGLSG
jgi:uncharacterized membrane protein YfcA